MQLVLLFPGQGSQSPGMARDLADAFPAARQVLETVDASLDAPLTPSDRPEFQRAIVRQGVDGQLHASNTGAQSSSRLASMLGANALLALPARVEPFAAGDRVEAILTGPLLA